MPPGRRGRVKRRRDRTWYPGKYHPPAGYDPPPTSISPPRKKQALPHFMKPAGSWQALVNPPAAPKTHSSNYYVFFKACQ